MKCTEITAERPSSINERSSNSSIVNTTREKKPNYILGKYDQIN